MLALAYLLAIVTANMDILPTPTFKRLHSGSRQETKWSSMLYVYSPSSWVGVG